MHDIVDLHVVHVSDVRILDPVHVDGRSLGFQRSDSCLWCDVRVLSRSVNHRGRPVLSRGASPLLSLQYFNSSTRTLVY